MRRALCVEERKDSNKVQHQGENELFRNIFNAPLNQRFYTKQYRRQMISCYVIADMKIARGIDIERGDDLQSNGNKQSNLSQHTYNQTLFLLSSLKQM